MSIETSTGVETVQTRCCIAGGGPAGMMLGFLLARAGVDVVVLEKHEDFLRDFRGDTIHPSTLEVMHELGILDEFLKRPHQEARKLSGLIGDVEVPDRRLLAPADPLPVHRAHAAVGFPRLHRRAGAALPDVPPADGGRGHRADRGGRAGRRGAGRRLRTGRSRFGPS